MWLLKKFKYESKLKTVEWSELRISGLTARRVHAQWTIKWHVSHLALTYVVAWDKYHGHEPQHYLELSTSRAPQYGFSLRSGGNFSPMYYTA